MHLLFRSTLIIFNCIVASSVLAQNQNNAPILTGSFIQGGLVFGKVAPGTSISINDREVRVSEKGDFIIGFGRNYPATATLLLIKPDGGHAMHEYQIKPREYKVQRINGLPKLQVNPDKKILVRTNQEAKDISVARTLDRDRMDFTKGFIWPAKGRITGVFGSQRVLNGEPRQPHYGIDIAAPIGTPVAAPAAGVVSYAEDMYFSGKTLVVDHGHNLSSSFLHLDKILVQVGDRVVQGQEIAHVGATGRVTGAHLDWRMNWHDQRIDPGLLLGETP